MDPIDMHYIDYGSISNTLYREGARVLHHNALMWITIACYANPQLSAIDVGCCTGNLTGILSNAYKQVYAFDPNPVLNSKILFQSLNWSIINTSKCSYTQCACGEYANEMTYYEYNYTNGEPALWFNGLHFDPTNTTLVQTNSRTVAVAPLDDLIAVEQKIGFIKIDAELHDYYVLAGARRIIADHNPVVIVEYGNNPDILSILGQYGYTCYTLTGVNRTLSLLVNVDTCDLVAIPSTTILSPTLTFAMHLYYSSLHMLLQTGYERDKHLGIVNNIVGSLLAKHAI